MGARLKVSVAVAALTLALALAGCASPSVSTSASSSSSSSSSASSVSSSASVSSSSSASSSTQAPGGTTATIDLDYSAGTGYEWSYSADPDGIVELVSQDTENRATSSNVSGGPLQDHFTFKALSPGEVVLTFELVRSWEPDNPAETQVYAFTVTDDLQMILNPYKSDFDNEPTIG